MIDTHCHLNFHAFEGREENILSRAEEAGVNAIIVPGTDIVTSQKSVELASRFENVYAAVGIHPHHVSQYQTSQMIGGADGRVPDSAQSANRRMSTDGREIRDRIYHLTNQLKEIEEFLQNERVVAVGEVGLDTYYYRKTKYSDYEITEEFLSLQKDVLKKQIELAIKYNKSVILHNREAKKEFLQVLDEVWNSVLDGRAVFHCCEPDEELLNWAKKNRLFIGVDGDVTYSQQKEAFVKKIPLDMLVLETDSPYLIPEPLRSQKIFPNEPRNMVLIAEHIAQIKHEDVAVVQKTIEENARTLFML